MKRKILVVVVVLVLAIAAWIAWNAVFEMGKHEDKLWLHRCNSMEKLREKIEDYPNVEIDVVYRDNGIFDVTHDADTTFKLPLDSFFNYMSKSDGHMWLDVKNLNGGNADEMLDDLDSLTSEYGIEKGQLIVESVTGGRLMLLPMMGIILRCTWISQNRPNWMKKRLTVVWIT